MTNELKPCLFCGGKATFYTDFYLDGIVECCTCFAQIKYLNNDYYDTKKEATIKWNTRQPVYNWKPIEELTEEAALKYEDILFYMRNTTNKDYILASVTYDSFTKRTRISSFELDSDFDFEDDATKIFSWYALLTPPERS